MKIAIITLVVIYLLICSAFYIFQRSFLYFPQPASYVKAITTKFNNRGQKLSGWVINPGKTRLLLYYGGNASAIETHIDFLSQVAPDYTIYLIPYRGYGNNHGTPSEQALYSDALHVYDKLKNEYQSISLVGRSLGSGVATLVAANRDVDKLVLITPYDSIENVAKEHYPFLPVSLLATDRFLSLDRADKISAKTLIVIASEDKVISRERSENLVKNFNPQGLKKVIIEGLGHNDISSSDRYSESIREFLQVAMND
jgi:uncharacterized protein